MLNKVFHRVHLVWFLALLLLKNQDTFCMQLYLTFITTTHPPPHSHSFQQQFADPIVSTYKTYIWDLSVISPYKPQSGRQQLPDQKDLLTSTRPRPRPRPPGSSRRSICSEGGLCLSISTWVEASEVDKYFWHLKGEVFASPGAQWQQHLARGSAWRRCPWKYILSTSANVQFGQNAFYLYMYSSLDLGVETGNRELANFIMRSVTNVSASLFRESIQP